MTLIELKQFVWHFFLCFVFIERRQSSGLRSPAAASPSGKLKIHWNENLCLASKKTNIFLFKFKICAFAFIIGFGKYNKQNKSTND